MKGPAIALSALLTLGAANGDPQRTAQVCSVRYDLVARFTYDQRIARKQLPGMIVKGRYSDGNGSFEFFDDDGFLALTMLLSNWQSIGVTERNRTQPVTIDRSDLIFLRSVTAVGLGYFNAALAYATAKSDLSKDEVAELQAVKEHLALWERVDLQAAKSLQAASGKVTLPTGFIASIGGYLERLRPDTARQIVSQYRDLGAGGQSSRLCSPDAANPLLGRILCDRDLGSGAARAEPYCAPGSSIASPSSALNCDSTIVDGTPRMSQCTAGAGGPPATPPKFD